jgi:hypothetical protein
MSASGEPPKITSPQAYSFRLADTGGRVHTLAEFRDRSVALYFFCGCERCVQCARTWASVQRGGVFQSSVFQTGGASPSPANKTDHHGMAAPQTLIVFAGNAPSALDFARETDLDLTQTLLLPDESLATATRFNATTCPRVFVVDSRGRVRYTNDHADDRPLVADASVIVARAVTALQSSTGTSPARPSHAKAVKTRSKPHA